MKDAKPISMTPDQARRIVDATRRVEKMVGGDVGRGRGPTILLPSRYAITTSVITAGNQAAKILGSGTAKLQLISASTSGSTTTYPYADLIDTGTTAVSVTVLNGGPQIAANRLVQIKVIDGEYQIDVDFCDGSSGTGTSGTSTSATPTAYVNSNRTITSADKGTRMLVDGSAGSVTLTLPDLASWSGPDIPFINVGPSGMFQIVTAGSDLIVDPSDGSTTSTFTATGPGTSFTLAPAVVSSPGVTGWYAVDV